MSEYSPVDRVIKLPKSPLDPQHAGYQYVAPTPTSMAALEQFERPFGLFGSVNQAYTFVNELNTGMFTRLNLIEVANSQAITRMVRTTPPYDAQFVIANAPLNLWGKHLLLCLRQGCVYDLTTNQPDHHLTAVYYRNYLGEHIIPDYVFQTAKCLPYSRVYARIQRELLLFKMQATENAGMYEML